MSLKIGITRFLGTNCDEDVKRWVEAHSFKATYLWFENRFNVSDYDAVIIPGGFSYGDYLRCGALAARTPVMQSVREFAKGGRPVLGICNGFQILCEAELLPGVLLRNKSLRFRDQMVSLVVQHKNSFFAKKMQVNQTLQLPIAHGDGCFYAEADTLKRLHDNQQIWLSYQENPNGSLFNIAGITNEKHNISAMMPHPERAITNWMGSVDGNYFL